MESSNLHNILKSNIKDSCEDEFELITNVKQEIIHEDVLEGIESTAVFKEEYKRMEAVKAETESKPLLLENFSAVDNSIKTDIKTEEIDIKSEGDDDIRDSASSHNVNQTKFEDSSRIDQCFSKTKQENDITSSYLRKYNKEKAAYKCELCNVSTVSKSSLKDHLLTHKKLDLFQCGQCEYRTNAKRYFTRHLSRHKNSKRFRCSDCDYETMQKDCMRKHLDLHKNPELQWFGCDHCEFKTIQKGKLQAHLDLHKSPDQLSWFQCECTLKMPVLNHENFGESDMFQCDYCEYKTIIKHSFKEHLLRHKKPDAADVFHCDHCDYKTIWKHGLKRHEVTHKNPRDLEWFRCSDCGYQTSRKHHFQSHMRRHQDVKEGIMLSCDLCTYQTANKEYYRRHVRRHVKLLYK